MYIDSQKSHAMPCDDDVSSLLPLTFCLCNIWGHALLDSMIEFTFHLSPGSDLLQAHLSIAAVPLIVCTIHTSTQLMLRSTIPVFCDLLSQRPTQYICSLRLKSDRHVLGYTTILHIMQCRELCMWKRLCILSVKYRAALHCTYSMQRDSRQWLMSVKLYSSVDSTSNSCEMIEC